MHMHCSITHAINTSCTKFQNTSPLFSNGGHRTNQSTKAYILPYFPLILNQLSSLINMNSLQWWCSKFVNWNLFLIKVNSSSLLPSICSYLSCKQSTIIINISLQIVNAERTESKSNMVWKRWWKLKWSNPKILFVGNIFSRKSQREFYIAL